MSHVGKWLDKVIFKIYGVITWKTITIHILPNLSRSKDNHTMKFGPLIKCNVMVLFKNHAENEAERLVPDLFLFFFKKLYMTQFLYISIALHLDSQVKDSVCMSPLGLHLRFSRKGSATNFSTTFCVWIFNENVCHFVFY